MAGQLKPGTHTRAYVPFIFSRHFGSQVDEEFHNLDTVVSSGKVERGGVTTLGISAVHVVLGHKHFKSIVVSILGSLQDPTVSAGVGLGYFLC